MNYYYHATSFENAQKIEVEGFHLSADGMFGRGIYFSENPDEAVKKARIGKCDAIIVVTLDVGRLLTEEMAMPHYDLRIIKKIGYDSIQMIHCRTGAEICIYEPFRAKIVSIVHWDSSIIEFKGNNLKDLNLSDFQSFLNGRKMILNPPNQDPPTYKEKSSQENISQKLKKIDFLESYISNRRNQSIINKYGFKNPADYCMKSLNEYLKRIAQLNSEFPYMKSELDQRIRNLISLLDSQYKEDLQQNEFAKSFLAGMMEVGNLNSCVPEIIKKLKKFLNDYNVDYEMDIPDYDETRQKSYRY